MARAAGDGVRAVPVVAAVQQRDASAVRKAHLLGRRRARLLVRVAAHAAEEEVTTLEGSAEADVERHVGAVDVEGKLGVLACAGRQWGLLNLGAAGRASAASKIPGCALG